MKSTRVVVIGNGMVGQRFLEELVARELSADITVFCEEPRAAYDRVQLSSYFSGASADDLSLVAPDFFSAHGIRLMLNESALRIDRERQLVIGSNGSEVPYDTLVLATGSFPFVPPIEGNDREACHVYRTLDDLDAIAASAKTSRSGVVIGGGLLGLEAAKALKDLGLETHVVEFAPQLMAVQLDVQGGVVLRDKIEALGVSVHTGKATQRIEAGDAQRHRLVFADGELETDLVLFSAGIRPRDQLAREAGLLVGERGGVIINDQCATSDPAIYAIGEVALWSGRIYGLVAPGYDMARQLAAHLAGDEAAAFCGADMSTKLKLLGVEVGSIGDAHGRTAGARTCQIDDSVAGTYKKLVLNAEGNRLLGAVLVGDTSDYGALLQYHLNDMALPSSPLSLILPAGDGKPALGVDALPDSAQICSCNNVSKGALCSAVSQGCSTMAALKSETRATATCGGCTALVKQVLDAELKRQGVAVNNHLCEHFAYSRQELYHVVRIHNIRQFDVLIRDHGCGHGCDICKPAAASIFASCWNDFVLDKPHVGLQDTNDNFLANLQKDGSYSVVPRIPGGEITPEKLIVIGEVAKKYDLYTKITGGQRIDLFGARVEQLPLIWRDLVDEGFESGHAYGKSLRTVKSCVGSTWCRYGVQDSVAMAILLEERYRGLRSPHKLKMAVSGCTRECAEAQSKDVGVIATEKGWNLYLCGNGGMRPRHAELFASDLDDATLLRYIDRFLMFYIQTADRLQRTSVWRDNLEGGLSYLQDVVIHDSLGLGAELEAQMQAVIDTYACEWKRTIEDPAALKRFRPFVNDYGPDESMVYVRERGQKRPMRSDEKAQALKIPVMETLS
ncbi:assimilatory nitrite reductase (NAD(P)H) large subunit precursor [Paraperlucidibaca baekdonensis]|uniref:Assimilatory nitrite reductase (NAD(P)H) large subunit n=1 Tax=Paraperlucidibaca baekdonensis TaxID=748120 RepID=A0A3E0H6H2_9GAMM|nr:nitrite reductase large subunit NirB [Paraperlucidibaca baekdonensis]REH38985.1 assimilatory nitrite reductase (NAD(P)H) large subunit precursor [Paraperlucidibaca baekdonensis]